MTYGPDFTNLANIQARTITWNADNMPTQINHSSNVTTQLTYGGAGERVKKRVYSGGIVTDTYYIGDHFEVKGGETIKYIFAGNLRVAQVKGSTRSFFHKDHLGSSTLMTNASGAELESTEYMPFGSQRSHSGTSTSDYRFTDQELDAENGLYNYNARLYDPFIGRFISADTIVPEPYNPQSLNRYTYCLNNPLIYVDPNGHSAEGGYVNDDDEWVFDEIVVYGNRPRPVLMDFSFLWWNPANGDIPPWIEAQMIQHQMEIALYGGGAAKQAAASGGGGGTKAANEKIVQAIESKSGCRDVLLLGQATDHWQNGRGEPLCVLASSIKISGVYSSDFSSVGDIMIYRTKFFTVNNDFLVYGNIGLLYIGNNQIILLPDNYGFEMHKGRLLRNIETAIAGALAGKGTPYDIYFKGVITIEPNNKGR